jgi:hypothetical protein
MGYRCHTCGSTDTVVVKKRDLEKSAGSVGTTGIVADPAVLRELAQFALIIIAILVPWLKDKLNPPYVVCNKCGAYKKLE